MRIDRVHAYRVFWLLLRATASAPRCLSPAPVPAMAGAPGVEASPSQAAKLALKGDFIDARRSCRALRRSGGDQARRTASICATIRNDAGYQPHHGFPRRGAELAAGRIADEAGRAHRSMSTANRPNSILAHFAKRQPVTPEGSLALARASSPLATRQRRASWFRRCGTIRQSMPALEKSVNDGIRHAAHGRRSQATACGG